jgi:hypothetical protein
MERIWSKYWWRNPDKEINRIHQRIQELRRIDIVDHKLQAENFEKSNIPQK